jgi:hypothetical protein
MVLSEFLTAEEVEGLKKEAAHGRRYGQEPPKERLVMGKTDYSPILDKSGDDDDKILNLTEDERAKWPRQQAYAGPLNIAGTLTDESLLERVIDALDTHVVEGAPHGDRPLKLSPVKFLVNVQPDGTPWRGTSVGMSSARSSSVVQVEHADFFFHSRVFSRGEPVVPMSVFLGLDDGYFVRVWPKSHHARDGSVGKVDVKRFVDVLVRPGAALIIRGDLVHAGPDNRGFRAFAYIIIDERDQLNFPDNRVYFRR